MKIEDSLQVIRFSEPILSKESTPNEFDVIYRRSTQTKLDPKMFPDYNAFGTVVLSTYINKLLYIIAETSPLKREKFIDYQISIHKDPLQWLIEVDECMRANIFHFEENTIDRESYYDFQRIIALKAKEQEQIQETGKLKFLHPKIQTNGFNQYLNLFEPAYFRQHKSVFYFLHDIREAIHLCSQEILDNLIILSNEEKKSYFEKIKFELKLRFVGNSDAAQKVIMWQNKFKVNDFNIDNSANEENRLYKILRFPENDLKFNVDLESEKDFAAIRSDFYLYYYDVYYNKLLDFLNEQERLYFPNQALQSKSSDIFWQKTDTDLLELITALLESGSITNQTKNLSRKDAIKYFESFFNLTIKDAENKLSKATTRKHNQNPFLESLTKAFLEYCNRRLG